MTSKLFVSVVAAVLAVYALACADVALRARSAYLQGEKYLQWYRQPQLKRAAVDSVLDRRKRRLDAEKAAGRMDDQEYAQRLDLLRLEHDEALSESSLKLAYRWYETSSDLFSHPDNPWARRSKARREEVGRLWRAELEVDHIRAPEPLP